MAKYRLCGRGEEGRGPLRALFGAVASALFIPVHLVAPPEPDLKGALMIAGLLALVIIPGAALLVPAICHRYLQPGRPVAPRRTMLIGGSLVIAITSAVYGLLPYLLTKDVELALRLGVPRLLYVLVLVPALGWVLRREYRDAPPRASP